MSIFKINPILPTGKSEFTPSSYTSLKITVSRDATQDEIDALSIPKYVGKFRPGWGYTIDLTPNESTGEINERGIKRITTFLSRTEGYREMDSFRSSNTAELDEFCAYHGIKY